MLADTFLQELASTTSLSSHTSNIFGSSFDEDNEQSHPALLNHSLSASSTPQASPPPLPVCTSTPMSSNTPSTLTPSTWAGFKIVGDNIDKNVQPRFMRLDMQTRSLHYFHAYAVKDRVDLSSFSDTVLSTSPLSEDELFNQILPSADDYERLSENFATLISRCLVNKIPFFSHNFKKATVKHIPHSHSDEMSQKSTIVSI